MWRSLQQAPIMLDEDFPSFTADSIDPLRTSLDGDVRLTISHVNRILAEATVSGLTLIRNDAQDERWFLPLKEVERTAAAAGLPLKPEGIGAEGVGLLSVLVLGVFLCVGLGWAVWRRG